jgi:N-methylhydantoinase B/oxoprolinase/acetone carboxylase alpha subunit
MAVADDTPITDAGRSATGAHVEGEPLDPASLQVLIARLTGIAEEMSAVLRRASFSPNIKERADCSCALFTKDGELLVQAENIPVHLGSMPASVAVAIERFGRTIQPGQQVILNDPFDGGTHLNDVTLVEPCFTGHELVGWVANRAHHADVGGSAPGSLPADAREVFEEGLRLPPVLLTDEVRAIILANTRTPGERRGDLDAQIGANRVGAVRMAELVGSTADGGGPGALREVLDYGERRMRAALAAFPDGTWHFEDVIDSTGSADDQQVAAHIRLAVTVHGDRIRFDFTGSSPQRAGNVNAPASVTASAVAWALRSVADPGIPANGGALRPVELVVPDGSILAARAPAAVGAGNVEVSQRVADVCLGALAGAVPHRVGAASQGTMNNLLIGGAGWVYYETVAGGQGGRPGRAGMSGVHTAMTNTKNTPVEAFERAYPLRVRRLRVAEGSGGAARYPGGDGVEREIELLEPATLSLITERRVSRPWGLAGGSPGAVGEYWLLPGGAESRAERLPDKCTRRLAAGDVIRVRTPGGGGWGTAIDPPGDGGAHGR